jgi:hypothetical protein
MGFYRKKNRIRRKITKPFLSHIRFSCLVYAPFSFLSRRFENGRYKMGTEFGRDGGFSGPFSALQGTRSAKGVVLLPASTCALLCAFSSSPTFRKTRWRDGSELSEGSTRRNRDNGSGEKGERPPGSLLQRPSGFGPPVNSEICG